MASPGRRYVRLETSRGHFALCSFEYLSLVEEQPIRTRFGIAIARPEMMALANLLHHPEIRPETMSGLIVGRRIRRSSKDLGRVLALAYLATAQDTESLVGWSDAWLEALERRFPSAWRELAGRAGGGLRALLGSESAMEEAAHTCNVGLLASLNVTTDMLRNTGRRLLQDAVEPLEDRAGESV